MKKEQVRTCKAFFAMARSPSMAIFDQIVIMEMSAVYFHNSLIKQQSKHWLGKGQPGPIEAKVQASRSKNMALAFLGSNGLININHMPRGHGEHQLHCG
jgi:hypothetical protein